MKALPRPLAAILAGYLILAVAYSIITPLFEASDELWHYPMVKYLADNGFQLPPQEPLNPGPWRQEGSQPPLYYFLAAALTGWIDTSDMPTIRRLNPHADIGVIPPDGNINMMVYDPARDVFPWRGTVLAAHLARLFSAALGAVTVILTYALACRLFPEQPTLAALSAAFTAFNPMFLFISGSVNNDNLSNLLGAALTLILVILLQARTRPDWRLYILLGLLTGAGLLSKLNLGFFIPLIALGLLLLSLRLRDWRPLIVGGVISGGLTLLIAGWWYWRNWQLYGDPSGVNRFLEIVGRRAVPANLAQLWSERHSFTAAYWGFFGGVNVPFPDAVYLVFNLIGGGGLLLSLVWVIRRAVRREGSTRQWLPLLLTLLWPLVTFMSYLRWTAETPASQGRLVFGALSCLSLWMAVGWLWWAPPRLRWLTGGLPAVFFVGAAALALPLVIAPRYQPPPQAAVSGAPQAVYRAPGSAGAVHLMNSRIDSQGVQPGQFVAFEMTWQIAERFDADWSLFVHLLTPDGVIVAQRDVYPGQGLLATSDLPAGRAWVNSLAVRVPELASAPMPLDVVIGWYHLPTGERLVLEDGEETWVLGQVELAPRPGPVGVPNPASINFGGLIELVGYEINDLSPSVGETVSLTLYWRGLQPIPDDYKVFANILDVPTLTKYAASDAMPVQWQAPTSTWTPGNIIVDTHTLTVAPDSPPGIYDFELGLYRETPEGLIRLRIVTPDGGMANTTLYLNRVRILPQEAP